MEPAVAPTPRPEHDLILGRYRPVRPLGTGGSASVWLAVDEATGAEVALKIVPKEGKAAERAEREAGAVERLNHPYCARVHASARDGEHVYVVYEYVAGGTLREALRERRLTDRDVVEIGAQLCEALAHAHSRGIVHRDVKPTNVVLAQGDGITVKLLDFGLAQVDGADALTAIGDVPGTLAYIAPERLDGLPTTGAADVWSVGLVLWEGLAGRHPFFAGSPVETARRIAQGPPPIREERPDLPPALVAAVDRALALDPYERPKPRTLARLLRASLLPRRERKARTATVSRRRLAERVVHGAASGSFVAVLLGAFPFFPPELTVPAAALAALVALLAPRAGLALALAAPVLPLADVSSGLAWAYGAIATAWLALGWRQPASALLVAAGPLLGLVGGLVALPLVALLARGPGWRFLVAALGVTTAVAWSCLRHAPLPLTGEAPPLGIGITGASGAVDTLVALGDFLAAHLALVVAAAALGLAGAFATLGARGPRTAIALGACLTGALLLVQPALVGTRLDTVQVVAGAALVAAALSAPSLVRRARRRPAEGPATSEEQATQLAALAPAALHREADEPLGQAHGDALSLENTELWDALVGSRAETVN